MQLFAQTVERSRYSRNFINKMKAKHSLSSFLHKYEALIATTLITSHVCTVTA